MIQYEPLNDLLLVQEDEQEVFTSAGIHLPQLRRQERARTGTVLKVGPGRLYPDFTRSYMQVEPGDRVMFDRYSGNEVGSTEERLTVISEKSLLAIIGSD